ncbi:MAG: hypothetical protein ACO2Y5_08875 [Nitrosopumilaceae archaeon]
MIQLTKDDKIEINRILESVKGRIDEQLCKLIMDLVFQNKVRIKKEDKYLYSANENRIPDSSIEAFSLGGFFGQTYQIALDLARKMDLKLDGNQKRVLREFTFFLVLFKFGKEPAKN